MFWQEYHEVSGQGRKPTRTLEAWKYLITDWILDNILQHTNQYIIIIQPNFSRESEDKLSEICLVEVIPLC